MTVHHTSIYRIHDYSIHLKNLTAGDKYSRFGYMVSDDNIDAMILNMCYHPKHHELWYAVIDDVRVGWGHLAKNDDSTWELAVSVERDYQRQGIGNQLIEEMLAWAKFHKVNEVYMNCIYDNKPIQHLARKNNLKTKYRGDGEQTSVVQLPNATLSETIDQMTKEHREIINDLGRLGAKLTTVWATPILPK
jgi:GNAT superfamily N-acetyltransferase